MTTGAHRVIRNSWRPFNIARPAEAAEAAHLAPAHLHRRPHQVKACFDKFSSVGAFSVFTLFITNLQLDAVTCVNYDCNFASTGSSAGIMLRPFNLAPFSS